MKEIHESHQPAETGAKDSGLKFYSWSVDGNQRHTAYAVFVRNGIQMRYSMPIKNYGGADEGEMAEMIEYIRSKGYSV